MGASEKGDSGRRVEYFVELRADAKFDLVSAHQWYEQQRSGLGRDFIQSVEDAIDRIRVAPMMFPIVHRGARQTLIRRFPYVIYYNVDGTVVEIVAVFHGHRDPSPFKDRA